MAKNPVWKLLSPGHLKATTLAGAGKPIVVAGAEAAGGVGGHGTTQALGAGLAAGTGGTMAGLVLFGGFGLVSAISNYVEYLHERADIANFYREELAAKSGKPQNQVTDADLSAAENGRQGMQQNHVIKEAVDHQRSHRNLGIASSFIASIAVFTLTAALGVHVPIGLTAAFGAQVALSVLAYVAIKSPLMKVGGTLFGLNKENTHEKIMDMARDREQGKAISREQVVEVFVSANKQLSHYVESHFGRGYEELTLTDKVKVAGELANVLPIDKIANSINLGISNVSELAFTVQGDVSGVLPKAPEQSHKPGAFERFSQRCKQVMHSIGGMFHAEKAHPIHTIAEINKAHHQHMHSKPAEESPIVELNEPRFADRVGASKHAEHNFAERVTSRREQVLMDGSQTIQ